MSATPAIGVSATAQIARAWVVFGLGSDLILWRVLGGVSTLLSGQRLDMLNEAWRIAGRAHLGDQVISRGDGREGV